MNSPKATTGVPQTHEQMLHVTYNEGNANQNDHEIHLTLGRLMFIWKLRKYEFKRLFAVHTLSRVLHNIPNIESPSTSNDQTKKWWNIILREYLLCHCKK